MSRKLDLLCNESLAKKIAGALHEQLFEENDPITVTLEFLEHYVTSITEGPGKHLVKRMYDKDIDEDELKFLELYGQVYNVPVGQVYVTVDSIRCLSGFCSTYKFSKQADGQLKLQDAESHGIS